ncbi:hypothetical protein CAPTEDRAFT_212611 [Capitella teleta]|uniref:DUF885 domain-containing protein n=1 Tax=Capitella teleta TaxID=283909 RepID=R7U1X5_CAPTE|nr:hypothetical protein CAPTEDRAFT_212611 [Capitella teleta]|eukprot:ELT99989.1 hypothetical protein CAPTEDRAFT_212611 [Capitella teleta]
MHAIGVIVLLIGLRHHVAALTEAEKELEGAVVDGLVNEFWEWRLAESPEYGTKYGLHEHDGRLEEYTEEAFSRQMVKAESMLGQVKAIRESVLPIQQLFSKRILQHNLQTYINGYPYRRFSMYNFFTAMTSANPTEYWARLISQMKFRNTEDYEMLLSRYRVLPLQFEQMIKLMKKAVESGTQQNAISFSGAVESMDVQLEGEVNETLFYVPFKQFPETMDESTRERLLAEGVRLIRDQVRPAIRELRNFVAETLIPNARPGLGVGSLDGGSEFYQQCVEWHTTTKMTAQEIYDLGLAEIERISKKMRKIMAADSFNGSIRDYVEHLRSDPGNFYASSDAMLRGYQEIVNKSHAAVAQILHHVPGLQVEVRPNLNPRSTGGFYADPRLDGTRPGIFYASVANAHTKLTMGMTSLTWHEAEPGHHTQMSFAIEQDIPDFRIAIEFRKYTAVPFNWPFMTAYIEGWAMYAEGLGEEYGAYTDSKMLWTLNQTVEFMANYTILSDKSLRNEIRRYISWPGQATAYKVGAKFNRKDFHTRVLELGPAPLFVLEDQIESWINETLMETSSAHFVANETLLILFGVLCFYVLQ